MPKVQQNVIESPDYNSNTCSKSYNSDSASLLQMHKNTNTRPLPLSNCMPSVRDNVLPDARDSFLPNIRGTIQNVEHSHTQDYVFQNWYNIQMRNLYEMRHQYLRKLNYIHFNLRSKFYNQQMLRNSFSFNQCNANTEISPH